MNYILKLRATKESLGNALSEALEKEYGIKGVFSVAGEISLPFIDKGYKLIVMHQVGTDKFLIAIGYDDKNIYGGGKYRIYAKRFYQVCERCERESPYEEGKRFCSRCGEKLLIKFD